MEALRSYVSKWNIELTDEQLRQFEIYYEMLVETNKVMNLTAITERSDVILKHFIDSIALITAYPEVADASKELSVIDVGTGAGFPGIPLKITFPHLKIILLDSLNKRVNFLNDVINRLELCDILAIHSRAEEGARKKEYREVFDLCVSRAVANMASLSEYCIPFLKKGGYFIPYKSGNIEEELDQSRKAILTLGGKLVEVKKLTLPGSLKEASQEKIERSFVIVQKTKETPKAYPRKAGTATKNPII